MFHPNLLASASKRLTPHSGSTRVWKLLLYCYHYHYYYYYYYYTTIMAMGLSRIRGSTEVLALSRVASVAKSVK